MKKIIKSLVESFAGKKEIYHQESGKNIAGELKGLQHNIGYNFKDQSVLRIALTHTSCYYRSEEQSMAVSEYERMEFLGDSILGFVTSEFLFSKYMDKKEGFLSKLKSQIVSENYLSIKAKSINLGDYIFLGDDEYKDRGYEKKSITSNMMESLICAIYFDGGIKEAKKFILNYILKGYTTELTSDVHINYKSTLQEYSQSKYKQLPLYKVMSVEGPDHKKIFTVEVYLKDRMVGTGTGLTKKSAEQEAAKEGCQTINI